MFNFVAKRATGSVAEIATTGDIGKIFFSEKVQKLLTEVTRYEHSKLFSRRPVMKLDSPELIFMTDKMLAKARERAEYEVRARRQMPPLLKPDTSKPKVLAKDEEIVGYSKHKVVFIDVSQGNSNRNRLMSVRETDGTLRMPTFEERSRLNHTFFPGPAQPEPPKMFEGKPLEDIINRKEYEFILNRACLQFEPDDPRYVEVTKKVYEHINVKGDYQMLRSTRHFGPMALYLVYNKNADSLILEMLSKKLIEDAAKLVELYYICHNVPYSDEITESPIDIIQAYSDNYSKAKHNLDLALQALSN